jgi:flavin-binding protein dodecin
MATHKVIEVLSKPDKIRDDAAQLAVKDPADSVRHIKSIDVKNMEGVVTGDKIIDANITFELEAWRTGLLSVVASPCTL